MITDLQLALSRKDFDELTSSLKVALDNHLAWLSDLNFSMICDKEQLANFCNCNKPYRQCKFGKWYYGVENTIVINHPVFIELGVAHKSLHKSVCNIVKCFADIGSPSKDIYHQYKQAEDVFLKLLNDLLHKALEANNNTDFLTGLPNRQALDVILKNEHARIKRDKLAGSLLILDIDFFKLVNDEYGHLVGDKVLVEISELLTSSIRDGDFTARFGGEEFVIYFANTDIDNSAEIAENLRLKIEEYLIEIDKDKHINITCSFGIATLNEQETITQSISNADEALYKAKDTGRNKVVVADQTVVDKTVADK